MKKEARKTYTVKDLVDKKGYQFKNKKQAEKKAKELRATRDLLLEVGTNVIIEKS